MNAARSYPGALRAVPGGPISYHDRSMTDKSSIEAFGPNVWLVDEMYRRFLDDPSSLSGAWQEFFEDYRPHSLGGDGVAASAAAPVPT